VIPQRFGHGPPPLTLGVEEELVILDAGTLDQVGAVERIVRPLEGRELPGRAKTELHASVFELNTNPCETADEVLAALVTLRRAAAEVAADAGLAIAATGTHPFAKAEAQPIVQAERYVSMVAQHGLSARRQNVQGLHVHLAMASAEDCWRTLEAMLPWLPVVLALSANSPWLDGELKGMASNRAPVLGELPRTGGPPPFGSYAEWEAWVDHLVRLGVVEDYTRMWWDVRPHPKLGTLEVRIADQPTDVRFRRPSPSCSSSPRHCSGPTCGLPIAATISTTAGAQARFGLKPAKLIARWRSRLPPRPILAPSCLSSRASAGSIRHAARADLQARFADPRGHGRSRRPFGTVM
jgi:carboxylate-amine ligase